MIDINKFIYPELIIPNLRVDSRNEAIRILVDKIFDSKILHTGSLTKKEAFDAVMEREDIQTTGIGRSMAFPHARIDGWKEFAVAFGICRAGIDFKSVDNIPVKFICLMISSSEEPYIILQTMASIIRFLNKVDIEEFLGKAFTASQIIDAFRKTQVGASELILAQDIARPITSLVTLDTSIEDATRAMHLNREDVLPVVSDGNKFCGVVSCLEVFEYGMPDFFKQLNTISFVKHIDPFEKYFRIKKNLKVKDLLIKEALWVKKDATLMEIIFEMTTKNKPKLFVLENDGSLIGVIDRFCVIDKILFL